MNWGWPQFVYAALIVLGFGYQTAKHGQPREPHNLFAAVLGMAIAIWLQYMGGFWTP